MGRRRRELRPKEPTGQAQNPMLYILIILFYRGLKKKSLLTLEKKRNINVREKHGLVASLTFWD